MTTIDLAAAPAQHISTAQATLELLREVSALASRIATLEAPRSPRK